MIIFIPVRLNSARLPNKVIADIKGLPMMIQVGNRAKEANVGEVVFACAEKELIEVANVHGFRGVLTDPSLASGTDRVHAGYEMLNSNEDNIINLQGDMPFINPHTIVEVAKLLEKTKCDMTTAAHLVQDEKDLESPSVVKVAMSHNNKALYFSRTARLPHGPGSYYKHLGIYGYKAQALQNFVKLSPSPLEKRESLEQLRALENDMTIEVTIVNDDPQSVDVLQDLVKVRM